jgi:hypothetical protein
MSIAVVAETSFLIVLSRFGVLQFVARLVPALFYPLPAI